MTKVKIEWNWIYWDIGNTWKKNILPQLKDCDISEAELDRCVYIIRSNGLFAINYPKKVSPTLYIGEGNFKNRIDSHKKWLGGLIELVDEFPFQIGVCLPRVKNNYDAYKEVEAALLIAFKKEYGCAPIKNRQMEKTQCDYEYYPYDEFRSAFMIGKGIRYKWAISPMKSNHLYDSYFKTCD